MVHSSQIQILKDLLKLKMDYIVEQILENQFQKNPEIKKKFTERDLEYSREDTKHNISYLLMAIEYNFPDYFSQYIHWLNIILIYRNLPTNLLSDHLFELKNVLLEIIRTQNLIDFENPIKNTIDLTIENLKKTIIEVVSYINPDLPNGKIALKYLNYLLQNDRYNAIKYLNDLVGSELTLDQLFLEIIQIVQYEIGRLWQINKISVAQEHYCTAVNQYAISTFYSKLFSLSQKKHVKIISTCATGELHEMGIRMLTELLELRGFDTYYYGANLPINDLLKSVQDIKPEYLLISVTMLDNIRNVKNIIDLIHRTPDHKIKIIVGGYPFNLNTNLWKELGADSMATSLEDILKLLHYEI